MHFIHVKNLSYLHYLPIHLVSIYFKIASHIDLIFTVVNIHKSFTEYILYHSSDYACSMDRNQLRSNRSRAVQCHSNFKLSGQCNIDDDVALYQ